jgi:NADH dehydrogenase
MSRFVLVTGAAGGLGGPLLRALRGRGWRVRCLVHRRPVPLADEAVSGSLEDERSLHEAAAGVDAVLHLAARTHARHPRAYRESNVAGTRRLLAAAHAAGVGRFVHVSTRAIDESGGAYSRSKAEAERLVSAFDMATTIVRLPEVFGTGSREGVDDIIERARKRAPIPVVGSGEDVVCPIHVDDAVDALAAALDAPAAIGRTYTLAGECLTTRRFAETCAQVLGGRSRVVGVPVAALRILSLASRIFPLPLYPDQLARLRAPKPAPSRDAKADLGFAPRPISDALAALGSA